MSIVLNDSWPKGQAPICEPHLTFRVIEHPIEVWTQAHGWIDRALDSPYSLISAGDIFQSLLSKNMTLWMIYAHGKPVGTFVTSIEAGSKGRALNIIAMGGEGMNDWIESWDAVVTAYARENRCRLLFEMGRRGWIKVFGNLGWIEGPAIMLKVL